MSTVAPNPTLADIAKEAGVSMMTVSRTLRGTGRIGAERRKQILELASRLGYRPNHAARSTATGRFNAVTIVLSTDPRRSSLPRFVLEGIHDEFARNRLHVNVAIMPDEELGDDTVVPELLRQTMSDGLLINYTDSLPANLAALIERHQLPAVWINHKQSFDAVYPDDFQAARDATRRLIEHGHRRIAYVDFTASYEGRERHYSSFDRRDGHLAELSARDIEPVVIFGEVELAQRRERIRQLLRTDEPTAVLTYSPYDAYAIAYEAALLGIEVPKHLSLASFDNRAWAYMGGFTLATQVVQERTIGEQAAAMLVRKIESGESEPSVRVPLEWVEGDSVARIPN